jgi:O-succinylbenzoic acid--CoA ligase
MLSSGSSSNTDIKSYAISKDAIRCNAKSVNLFLKSNENDKWLCSLPFFHIGGLSIYMRSILSGAKVIEANSKWEPESFLQLIASNNVSLTSLVPTQLYDLIKIRAMAPNSLRGVFIGGDFLSEGLKEKALDLGWPLIQTYGMTETCSQIASSYSSEINEGFLKVLDIHTIIKKERENIIVTKSLFTSEIIIKNRDNFKVNNSESEKFILKDNIELRNQGSLQFIKPVGRIGEEIKVRGRLFNFLELKEKAHAVFLNNGVYSKIEIAIKDDERDGKAIELLYEAEVSHLILKIKTDIELVFPGNLKISKLREFSNLPRTQLGKLKITK